MIFKQSNLNCTLYGVAGRIVLASLFIAAARPIAFSQSPSSSTAPTAVQSADAIDLTWQEANRKFDSKRAEILKGVEAQAHEGPFRPDWETLSKYEAPQWYKDAKFGIFIHWGIYSVPAFGSEWYPRQMYQQSQSEFKHEIETHGPQSKFGYKDFIPMFKAENFDAQAWAQLFKAAGARYVVPVAEHHDGFAMYDSDLSDWTAAKMGPKRDVVGELAKAVRAEGLHFGASSHRAEHNFFFDGGRSFDSDVNDPKYASLYGPAHRWIENRDNSPMNNDWTYVSPQFTNDWLARSAEIVEKYNPEIMYFDWWIGQPNYRKNVATFASFYYNYAASHGFGAVINFKDYSMDMRAGVKDFERGQQAATLPLHWQTDTSVSNQSWGYIDNDTFKTPEFIVLQLVDIVSKNGNLLLNIGPRSDGTIPEPVQQTLLAVGDWLKINGEAIYETTPWKTFGEGPTKVVGGAFHDTENSKYTAQDFRFTMKGNTLYAIEMGWSGGGDVVIQSFGTGILGSSQKIKEVTLLGSTAKIEWQQHVDGLHMKVPAQAPGKYAYAFKIPLENATK